MIEESGPGYSLRFSGQVHEDRMYGKIDDDLEIFNRGGAVLLKMPWLQDGRI